jgi:serine protease
VRRLSLAVLLCAVAIAAAPTAAAHAGATTGRILVTFARAPAGAAHASRAAGLAHAAVRRDGPQVPALRLATVRPDAGTTVSAALRALRADPRVRGAVAERRFAPRVLPNDPALSLLDLSGAAPAGTPLQWTLTPEGFPTAWQYTNGAGALIAVIDTGVDATHPEFQGKIAGAIGPDGQSTAAPPTDQDGHGTHVASIACAATGNGIGIAGAGANCRLLVVRSDLNEGSVIAGLVAAVQHGAQAINLSLGISGAGDPELAAALHYAVDHGAVPVAAAADTPTDDQGAPASLLQPSGTGPHIRQGLGLVVTAAKLGGTRASFAGYGSEVSLAAYGTVTDRSPAHGIVGAYPAARTQRERGGKGRRACHCRVTIAGDDRYAFLAGTSMATPQVTAAAGLVRTVNPALSVADVVRVLKRTARRPAGSGWTADLGWGILDAGAAVDAARRIDRLAPHTRARAHSPARGSGRRVRLRVRFRGSDRAPAPLVASGIRRYEAWVARRGRRAHRVGRTRHRSLTVRLAPGRYRLWSVAVDRAGNREARPRRADVRLRVIRR